MPLSSPTSPPRLVGTSNGPIRWGEAVRITGLWPTFWSSPNRVNRAEEALDASPHPNGLGQLGAIGLGRKWDGPKAGSSRVYGLYTHPGRYGPFWAPDSGCCRRADRAKMGAVGRSTAIAQAPPAMNPIITATRGIDPVCRRQEEG